MHAFFLYFLIIKLFNLSITLIYRIGGAAAAAPVGCALTGRRRRRALEQFIDDKPINGIHYREDNLMTEEDKEFYLKTLKASKASEENTLTRTERDLKV